MRGFVSLPTGQKLPSCASAHKQCGQDVFMHARFLAHRDDTTMSADRLTPLTLAPNIMYIAISR